MTRALSYRLSERTIARLTASAVLCGLTGSVVILALMLLFNIREVPIELGKWVHLPEEHFHFHFKLLFDRLSVPFAILSFVLCGVIGAFTSQYLHRELGYYRFFVLYSLFLLGMILSSLAGTIETLFFGWELVGLSSALLVAFFHERPNPVRNGLRVWIVYRIADAAFLIATITLHHLSGAGDFDVLMGQGSWPFGQSAISPTHALLVGSLLLVAAAGKSALIPFSAWLPRAMEGPTPSSAVFYGALSVHLGAFLLLRFSPILETSLFLSVLVVTLGLCSAIFGTLCSRVQSDVKSALAFASMTQVGLIVAEIGCGLRYIPLIHIMGHACLRTLQLLRAPTLLQDYRTMENAIGSRLTSTPTFWERSLPGPLRTWLYRVSLERGYLDAIMEQYLVEPFLQFFRWSDRMERKWTDFLSNEESFNSGPAQPNEVSVEEFH